LQNVLRALVAYQPLREPVHVRKMWTDQLGESVGVADDFG
jgi:hypothetical protein